MMRSLQPPAFRAGLCAAAIFGLAVVAQAQPSPPRAREFRPGALNRIEDLPAGRFRAQVDRLPAAARNRAMAWLGNLHFTELDLNSLHADPEGAVFYADEFVLSPVPAEAQSEPPIAGAAVPVSPFPSNLVFHSRPGAPNVLFLNFSGESVSGTGWNNSLGRSVIPAVAFSTDADYSTFSDAEQLAIKRIWQRVAEDYAPFDIDVTTERPGAFGNRTAHALITRNTDANGAANPSSSSGGVAYVGVFGGSSYNFYRPAWIYVNNLASQESYIAEAAAHEVGHNMGLSHDGRTDGVEYYGGHGSGDTSWAPIMGTGYNRNVSQWSKGEYYLASNTQDDLATIAAKLSYRADDHGDTPGSATPLTITDGTDVLATTPDNDPANTNSANKGVIERATDADVFAFVTGTGPISLTVNAWAVPSGLTDGGNLDVVAQLYDASGMLLLTNNSSSTTFARIQTTLAEGIYYLAVRNSGAGSPSNSNPTGYTPFGSIGQYFISGFVVPSGIVIPPGAELQVTDITQTGAGPKQFTLTYSDNAGIDVATIDSLDIRLTGPHGYDRAGQLVSVNAASNGTPRVATYSASPPVGGVWTDNDNGTYLIRMQTNQVLDVEGVPVAAGLLGQFTVSVPRPLYIANMDADPGWTLQPQWEHGKPAYPGAGPTNGFTGTNIIAYNLDGNYENNLATAYATTPQINGTGASTLTLQFRRWLRLRNNDTALIQVSTNGTAWTNVWSTTRSVTDGSWQEVQYPLPDWTAGSATVRLRWGIASGPTQTDIGWNIDDVAVLGGGNLDTTPPTATLNVANITSGGSPSHSFTVTFSDNSAVDIASLDSADFVVTGPNAYSNAVEFVGVDVASSGTPRTANYSVPSPGGDWDPTDNGSYQIVLQDAQVTDTFNNATDGGVLGGFTVAISASQQALVVDPTALTVPEGGNAVFTIRLAEQPSADVTVTVLRVSGDADVTVQSTATNVFTLSNWSNAVPVTLIASTDADQQHGTAAFECRSDGLAPITVLATEADTTPDAVLAVSVNNNAWGTVSPSNGAYTVGSPVQITATPSVYYQFVQWTGDASGTNNPLTVLLNANVTIQAVFGEVLTAGHSTPQWWLASYGHTNDFESAEQIVGTNGIPLWQSYVAGLDPNDPDSQFRVMLSLGAGAADPVVQWNTVTGRVYTVFQSTNLNGAFLPIPGAANLPAAIQSYTNAPVADTPAVFYRIEVRKL